MAPVPITEDYYMVLEVGQTATLELVVRSYKRLALKLHPDRNDKHDATEAFQLLGRAYETLKDESKRRAYDLIYPTISRNRSSSQTPRPPPGSPYQSGALNEAAQIAALQKSKQERSARWRTKKIAFDSTIFELQRDVRWLEQEINDLDSIVAADAAKEAQKNSWGAWLLSPIYKQAEDSEEEKERKERKRQETRIQKDMKERRLSSKKTDLEKEESLLRKAKEEVEAADMVDDGKIRVFQDRIRVRETWKRQEKEREERERIAKIWKQQQEQREVQQKREREAAEMLRKQRAEERAAEQKREEEHIRKLKKILEDEARKRQGQHQHHNPPEPFSTADGSTRQVPTSICGHDGWWPKVQGRTACPKCYDVWTYLLQCPSCNTKACPKCQAAMRPRVPRNTMRTNRRAPPRVRTPSPSYFDGYF